jgi:HK97 gp10 family phage protein
MKVKLKIRTRIPAVKVMREVEKALDRPLAKSASFMAGVAREMVRIPFPPSSSPWAPPHLRSGTLRTSIKSSRRKKSLYWISASAKKGGQDYAGYLEFGTKKMKPRPFMRPMMLKIYRPINTFFKGAF